MSLTNSLTRISGELRSNPVTTRIIDTLGLHNHAVRLYWSGSKFFYNSDKTVSIEEVTATFLINSPIEASLFDSLGGEEVVLKDFLGELSQGDVFYDVGAHVGLYSCLAGVGGASVIAFDPDPYKLRQLQKNADLNTIDVQTKEVALSGTEGVASLDLSRGKLGSLRGGTEVDLVRCDDLVEDGLSSPDVMKIDVEGGEMDVLAGMETTLKTGSCRVIYCEIHENILEERGVKPDSVLDLLSTHGFDIEVLQERGNTHTVKATRGQ